ncbi:hypothetical protein [Burkholderia gladioli]|uniref:hypothetical protein n=1 Tax=Burkholderia gladioli TaxID=28095 RepID=UPI001641100C|nr:hypothetical protein [Burkholderia gladioli]MDN7813755.1 hypothetical protein [Burkholderia gladioli]
MLIREQGRLIKVMRADSPDGDRRDVRSRPRGRTRHVVLGVFHADGEVPASLAAALAPKEREVLCRWLDAYRRSQPAASMPPAARGNQQDLDALVTRVAAVADSVPPAEAEALRSRLQRVKRTLTRSSHDVSRRNGPQQSSSGAHVDLVDAASSVGTQGATASS